MAQKGKLPVPEYEELTLKSRDRLVAGRLRAIHGAGVGVAVGRAGLPRLLGTGARLEDGGAARTASLTETLRGHAGCLSRTHLTGFGVEGDRPLHGRVEVASAGGVDIATTTEFLGLGRAARAGLVTGGGEGRSCQGSTGTGQRGSDGGGSSESAELVHDELFSAPCGAFEDEPFWVRDKAPKSIAAMVFFGALLPIKTSVVLVLVGSKASSELY